MIYRHGMMYPRLSLCAARVCSAWQAKDYARAAQGHAEGAARELLAAKRAELQAAALLNGGKNPDPASAEVLKAQAAAKCAEQLKVIRLRISPDCMALL
jgi:hypothetical protein